MGQNKKLELQIDSRLSEIARKTDLLRKIQEQINFGAADAEVLRYQMLAGVSILETEFEELKNSVQAQVTVHGTLEDWANRITEMDPLTRLEAIEH